MNDGSSESSEVSILSLGRWTIKFHQKFEKNMKKWVCCFHSLPGNPVCCLLKVHGYSCVQALSFSADPWNSADFDLPKGGQSDLCKSTEKFDTWVGLGRDISETTGPTEMVHLPKCAKLWEESNGNGSQFILLYKNNDNLARNHPKRCI